MRFLILTVASMKMTGSWWKSTNILDAAAAAIIRATKCHYTSTRIHDATYQKTVIFSIIRVYKLTQ
jgi:hypothetical protein